MSSNCVMARRYAFLTILVLMMAVLSYGQIIGIPGIGFPGRRNPGQQGPYPGNGQNQPTQDFVGMLRTLSNSGSSTSSNYNQLVLETDDHRIINFSLDKRTRYVGTSGGNAKLNDLNPGDHIDVAATQDFNSNNDSYRALKVTQLRVGTPEERAEASAPIDGGASSASRSGGSGSGSSSPADDDPGRPRLRRAPSSDSDTPSTASSGSASSSPGSDDPDRPRMRRPVSSDGDGSAPAQINPGRSAPSTPVTRANDDPGPPVLRRGTSAPRDTSSSGDTSTIADARPSIQAQDVNGVTRLPTAPVIDNGPAEERAIGNPRMSPTGDDVIDQAREEAFSFSETLPNYVVKQYTTRYVTEAVRGRGTSWRALDNVTADLVYQEGKESYKNFQVNGRPAREAPEKSGSWSSGEFASTLQDIMSPITNADFHGKKSTSIVNRSAYRYDFSVEQPNSHWHVEADHQSYQPAFTGSVWIDKENFRVLRIELQAKNMPRSFPLDQVESSVDYDYVLIGDQKYLLPVHSEALSCARGSSDCSRNTIEFRNYRKFGADTNITFDTGDAADKTTR